MPEFKPESARILGTILRELEQTIIPDLNSTHSKTVASLMGQGLRNLLTRETVLPEMLETWTEANNDLLRTSNKAAHPQNSGDCVAQNNLAGNALTAVIEKTEVKPGSSISDPLIRKAIEAEECFLADHQQAIDTYSPLEYSQERKQLFALTEPKLTRYFRGKLPEYKTLKVTSIRPILSGFSKETTLVDIEADGTLLPLVIRRNITYGAVDSNVEDEYPIVSSLFKQGLPVPEPVLLESDKSLFGEAFTVTKRAPGEAACNSMAGLVAGPKLKSAALELAAFLAKLHSIPLETLDLSRSFYDPDLSLKDYLVKEIDICERYQRNHSLQPSATITAALKWLRANIPDATDDPRLVHGDAALANLMMHKDKISVMLDWELAHPGDPVEDMTYTRKWIDQVLPWDEFLNQYYAHGGDQYHPESEKFYAVLSDLRVALFSMRVGDMFIKTDQPLVSQMYGGQHYYGHFVRQVANNLLS